MLQALLSREVSVLRGLSAVVVGEDNSRVIHVSGGSGSASPPLSGFSSSQFRDPWVFGKTLILSFLESSH